MDDGSACVTKRPSTLRPRGERMLVKIVGSNAHISVWFKMIIANHLQSINVHRTNRVDSGSG